MTDWEVFLLVRKAAGDDHWRRTLDVVLGWQERHVLRDEAEQALTGLVEDPAALLDEIASRGEVL
jgi:hypothetical protein